MTQNSSAQSQICLYCCNGNPAPLPVVDGWKRFLGLPQKVRVNFWALLGPCMLDVDGQASRELVDTLCKDNGLSEQDVVAAVQSCDFIIRQATALDLSIDLFQQDLAALSTGDSDGAKILLSQYESMKSELRIRLIQESLADHGNILVGLDWRIDEITASDRGTQLNTAVVFLTLRYRDGNQIEKITLQLTPESMKELKRFTDRFGGKPL